MSKRVGGVRVGVGGRVPVRRPSGAGCLGGLLLLFALAMFALAYFVGR